MKARNDLDCIAHGRKLFILFINSFVEPSSEKNYSEDEQKQEKAVVQKKFFPKDSLEALTNRQKNIQRRENFLKHNRSKTNSNYKPRQL